MIRSLIVALGLALLVTPSPAGAKTTAADSSSQFKQRVRVLLDDYSRKDVAGIIRMLDERNVMMMGTDISEVASSKKTVEALLENDFRLWDTSRFGEIRNFYVESSDTMATAFFDVPWEASTGSQSRRFIIRLVTTWRKSGGDWKLTQILNTVPTTGQSAAEILNASKP
jgi:hypothetical protein